MTGYHVSTAWWIVAATLAAGPAAWFSGTWLKARNRGLLVTFVMVAGAGSAALSPRYPGSAWFIFLGALLVAVLLWTVLRKLFKNLSPTSVTWGQFLKGQGLLLFVFLLVGGGFAWLSVAYGPYPGRISKGGQLLEFRGLDPSQQPVYRRVDVENYAEITVLTKTIEPKNGVANVTIYLEHGTGGELEVGHLDSEETAWSRWGQANAGKRMSLVTESSTQAGSVAATKVDILVYLTPK